MATLITINEPVTASEKNMLARLQRDLPPDWVVFGNPRLVKGYSAQEVDALVVGDKGVWVVDDKDLGGEIKCTRLSWTLPNGHTRKNPLESLENACIRIKSTLQANLPHTGHLWVRGLIILPDNAVLKLETGDLEEWVRSRVVTRRDCVRRFLSPKTPAMNSDLRNEIINCLMDQRINVRLNSRFTQVESYEILEKLSESGAVRTFRARRARSERDVELKVYDLSYVPNQQSRADLLRLAERESEALRRLMDTAGIVRIEESFQDIEGYGGELYYTAISLPTDPSLATRIGAADWPLGSRLLAAQRLCQILRSVHAEGIIHRNLSPACIYFHHSDTNFQLTGFEFSRIAQMSTLHITPDDLRPGCYAAPEVTVSPSNASEGSDVYSLGVILFQLLSGALPFGERTRASGDPAPTLPPAAGAPLPPQLRGRLEELLRSMLAYEPRQRPVELEEVLKVFNELVNFRHTAERHPARPGGMLAPGDRLGDQTVLEYIDTGGCFHVYKVGRHAYDAEPRVAKVIKDSDLLELAGKAFVALQYLSHPSIPRPFDVSMRPEAAYHLLEEFVPGKTAAKICAKGQRSPADLVARWGYGLADALAKMEALTPPLYHGDISAKNILIDGNRACLIDLGSSLVDGFMTGARPIGTPRYTPPGREVQGVPWPPNGDVYSLGVVLCQLLFGQLPYETNGDIYRKERLRDDLFTRFPGASSQLLATLRRAVAYDPSERYATARELRAALAAVPELAGEVTVEEEEKETVIVVGGEKAAEEGPARGEEPEEGPPEQLTFEVRPVGKAVTVLAGRPSIKAPQGYKYMGVLDGLPAEHFYRQQDGHVAVLCADVSGLPPFLVDKYAVTAEQFSSFLNDLAGRGLLTVEGAGGESPRASVHGRLVLSGAFIDLSRAAHRTGTATSWGLTYDRGGWRALEGAGLMPAVMVTWWGAKVYGLWAHNCLRRIDDENLVHLPTSQQWQAAAFYDPSSGHQLRYPWGNAWDRSRVNYAGHWAGRELLTNEDYEGWREAQPLDAMQIRPVAVGALAEGHSPLGCVQMLGNVWEWSADPALREWVSGDESREDPARRLVKGGACNSPQEKCARNTTLSWRSYSGNPYIGFRCALTL